MGFDEFEKYVSVLSQSESNVIKDLYINEFIDAGNAHYRDNIATIQEFSDGWHYSGYLWECLIKYEQITMHQLKEQLLEFFDVIVFWDNHSSDRIVIPDYWKFPRDRAIKVAPIVLVENFSYLPEDIYICDYSFSWTLVLTHEDDGKRRICYIVDNRSR